MTLTFTDAERAVLRIAQADLPDSLTPYKDMAVEAGLAEEEVLALLTRLKENGAIRRFGASIKHQKTGWTHNAMVAWKVEEADVDACGELAAAHERISHVYCRPSPARDWPYTLYTMIHGRSEAECLEVVEYLARNSALKGYAVLNTLKELKKISMTYFP
jgi:DNA-binding Lrp family transcriptional regulator